MGVFAHHARKEWNVQRIENVGDAMHRYREKSGIRHCDFDLAHCGGIAVVRSGNILLESLAYLGEFLHERFGDAGGANGAMADSFFDRLTFEFRLFNSLVEKDLLDLFTYFFCDDGKLPFDILDAIAALDGAKAVATGKHHRKDFPQRRGDGRRAGKIHILLRVCGLLPGRKFFGEFSQVHVKPFYGITTVATIGKWSER
jgi:hypothetical protein